jgi:hypothetical protein
MTHVQEKNQLNNKEISPQAHGEQKGKGITKARMAWSVIALLAAGFFLHDAVWHLMLVLFGMNAFVGMEFSLPDLGAYQIYPDRVAQMFAFLFATVAAGLLLWLGLWLGKRR